MEGYHVYYQLKRDTEFNTTMLLVQALSALFWKVNEGPIKLYCNDLFLKAIKEYDIDTLYDSINTECFSRIPEKKELPRYWSFPKIQAANDIINTTNRFCIIDTDLWIHDKLQVNWDEYGLITYHKESPKSGGRKAYPSPQSFNLPKELKDCDWTIDPVNGAFIYLNSEDLVKQWYTLSLETIKNNKDKRVKEYNADTLFIEQRMIGPIANKLQLKQTTLVPNVYQPYIKQDGTGNEWVPPITDNPYDFWNIKHIWGLKGDIDKNNYDTHLHILNTLLSACQYYLTNKKEYSNNNNSLADILNAFESIHKGVGILIEKAIETRRNMIRAINLNTPTVGIY